MGRPSAVIGVCVLGLGLAGIASAGVARRTTVAKVMVTFTDTKLVVSRGGLQAGTATFVIVNKGHKLHVLTIAGPGLKGERTRKVAAGRTAALTVTMLTGAYMLSDPAGLGSSIVRWVVVSPATVGGSSGQNRVPPPSSLSAPGMDCE
jgi:hypothetical protein